MTTNRPLAASRPAPLQPRPRPATAGRRANLALRWFLATAQTEAQHDPRPVRGAA